MSRPAAPPLPRSGGGQGRGPTTGLGLDAGGSATRWALCDAGGTVTDAGELPPISGHLFNEPERDRMQRVAAMLQTRIGTAPPTAVVAGITGLSSTAPEAATAAAILAEALHLAPAAVRIEDDIWIAYHAAFAPGEGHVVYAGSGSIGIHIRADGSTLRAGGRGMLIDDAGSAFWIGREALCLIWRRIDEDASTDFPLAREIAAAIGDESWDVVRAHVYGGGRTAIAMLARAVARADDEPARAILRRAGRELARLACALVRRAGEKPIALLGRAASLHPAILDGFREAAPHLSVRLENPDAAIAAARLAAQAAPAQAAPRSQRGKRNGR